MVLAQKHECSFLHPNVVPLKGLDRVTYGTMRSLFKLMCREENKQRILQVFERVTMSLFFFLKKM